MGGKNPQVILDDADLAQAVELSAQSAFFSTGQRCTASSRLIVTQGIYPAFVKALQERMARIKVGDALATLLEFAGHNVIREYYVNDAGGQVDVLARPVQLRYGAAIGQEIGELPEGLCHGDYLLAVAPSRAEQWGSP